MTYDIEVFLPIPAPQVRFYGSAAHESGRALAHIVEFTASRNFYLVGVELPQVNFNNGQIEWLVDAQGEVTIEGHITPAAIFTNMPIGRNTKRIKLCPLEPWGMSFNFPGPVDWTTAQILFTSKTVMEITVMKARPPPQLAGIVPNEQFAIDPADVPLLTLDEIDQLLVELFA